MLPEQDVLQEAPKQEKPLQDTVPALGHALCAPSQLAAGVTTPDVQEAVAHCVPAAINEHVHKLPDTAQDWQSLAPPPHSVLQHTPSTQLPLLH